MPRPPRPVPPTSAAPVRRRATTGLRRSALLVALAVLAGACSLGGGGVTKSRDSPPRGEADAVAGGALAWTTCTEMLAAQAGLQCATLDVPREVDEPGGPTIELALARRQATGSAAERLGSVVFNPGGPGGSGIEFLAGAAASMPEELAARFDLVSFDPRGVGASSPVRCVDDQVKDEQLEGDLSPDTEAELQEALAESREFVQGCQQRSGEMIEHMSTADVAADLDRIREALGDEQLTYVGFSYGTSIGAVYATLFPENVRAIVLDGSTSPSASAEEQLLAQGRGFEGTLASFVRRCDADARCALGPDAASAIAATRADLERAPVEVSGPTGARTLGLDQFDFALATALYDTSLWGTAAGAIANVRDGGAEVLLALMDRQTGRNPDGTYDNSTDAQSMVNCADDPERPSVDEGVAAARRVIEALPTFGDTIGWGALGCVDWPLPANPLPPITGAGSASILVVGTVGDPATPYLWSEEMAAALESSRLLTYEGDGHTAFLRGGPCIDDAVVAYLIDLSLPAEGTRCPGQDGAVSFGGLRDAIVDQFVDLGLPETVAACVVDGVIDDVGADEFDRMILTDQVDELSGLVQEHSLSCAIGG